MKRLAPFVLTTLASTLLPACGHDSEPVAVDGGSTDAGAEVAAPTFEATIGPEGGAFSFDGDRGVLFVPAGVLSAPTKFTATVKTPADYPGSSEVLGPIYEMGPDGFKFPRGVTLSTKPSKAAPTGEIAVVAGYDPAAKTWVPLVGSHPTGDAATLRAVGKVEHFSAYTTFHSIFKFDEACRPLSSSSGYGINGPDTLQLSGATVTKRYVYGGLEYGSTWTVTSPTVTITGQGLLDGPSQWGAWKAGSPGMPKPTPIGFDIKGNKFSFVVDIKTLAASGYVALSVDDRCWGDYDIGFTCEGGCLAPAPPVPCQVGSAVPTGVSPNALAVTGTTLLGADDGTATAAFQTWSLAAPKAPVLQGSLDLAVVGTRQLAARGTTAFVTDGTRIRAIDVKDPTKPAFSGEYDLDKDAVLKAALGSPSTIKADALVVDGSKAYVATTDRGFVVLDVTNPAAIVRLGHAATASYGTRQLVVQGTNVYLAAQENRFCIPSPCSPPNFRGLVTFDVSDPANPKRVGEVAVPTLPMALAVGAGQVYLMNSDKTFTMVDVTDPKKPVVGLSLDVNGIPYNAAISGGKLYVAATATDGGHLSIFTLADPKKPVRLSDEGVSPTGGARGLATGPAYAYVASKGKLTVIDLACP